MQNQYPTRDRITDVGLFAILEACFGIEVIDAGFCRCLTDAIAIAIAKQARRYGKLQSVNFGFCTAISDAYRKGHGSCGETGARGNIETMVAAVASLSGAYHE